MTTEQKLTVLLIALVAAIAIAIYLLPWLIARTRDTEHTTAIGLLNLLLGWTAIGYLAALIWAITDQKKTTAQELKKLTHRAARNTALELPHLARAKHEQPEPTHPLPHSVRKRQPWQNSQ
jgi:cytochrome bd-type quinol oxidase subunit 2